MPGRRVAVLGAAGFIGQHLASALIDRGHDVRVVDRRPPAGRARGVWERAAETRLLDLRTLPAAVAAVEGCDWVCHLAADMGGVAYFHGPADWKASVDNGRITTNVVQASAALDIDRLLYTSSACAYPVEQQQGRPVVIHCDTRLTEEQAERIKERWLEARRSARPLVVSGTRLTIEGGGHHKLHEGMLGMGTPDQLYGAEKLHGLRLVANAPVDGRVAVLHTVYGPGQEATGPRAKFPPSIAWKALHAAHEGGPVEVWGDAQQLRSYLYVDDAVHRLVTLLEADIHPGPVNVGAEGAVSCLDVARVCCDLVGIDHERIVTTDGGPTGVRARDCDNTLWRRTFGEPPERGIRDGFEALIAALREDHPWPTRA